MIFFDTNILIYSLVKLDREKSAQSSKMILEAIDRDEFFVSSLVISEFIHIMNKLKQNKELIDNAVNTFIQYTDGLIDVDLIIQAYAICSKAKACINFQDSIHIAIAEKFCEKIITFNKDFRKYKGYSNNEIQILKY